MTQEISDIVEDEEKADKLQKIIEQKVQEEVQKTVKNLKNSEENQKEEKEQESEEVSRRSFLKKLGAGAIGLGAASLIPSASAYQVKSSHGFDVTTDGTEYFDVDPNGKVKVKNAALQLDSGQSIEDDSGTKRVEIDSGATSLVDSDGNDAVYLGSSYLLEARSGTPWIIYDRVGDFEGVHYDPDNSAGVLRTPGAGMFVEGDGTPSGSQVGGGLQWQDGNTRTRLYSYDFGNNSWKNLQIAGNNITFRAEGGLVDLTEASADLRLSTGQSIEDGSGTERVNINTSSIKLRDGSGTVGVDIGTGGNNMIADDSGWASVLLESNKFTRLNTRSGQPFIIRDREGSFDAVQYTTDSSKGKFELKNAEFGVNVYGDDMEYVAGRNITLGVKGPNDYWVIPLLPLDGSVGGQARAMGSIYGTRDTNNRGSSHTCEINFSIWLRQNDTPQGVINSSHSGTGKYDFATFTWNGTNWVGIRQKITGNFDGVQKVYFTGWRKSDISCVDTVISYYDRRNDEVDNQEIYDSISAATITGRETHHTESFEIHGGNIQLDTDQAIKDSSGTKRFELGSSSNKMFDDYGNYRVSADGSKGLELTAWGGPVVITDKSNGFTALQYKTGSAPGTLELTNSDLELNGNSVTDDRSKFGMRSFGSGVGSGDTFNLTSEFGHQIRGMLFVWKESSDTDAAIYLLVGNESPTLVQDSEGNFGVGTSGGDVSISYNDNGNGDYYLHSHAGNDIITASYMGR